MSACIIPIPAEVEQPDGGLAYTPFVKSALPPMPGNLALPPEVTLTLEDGNVTDTLYVRVFRDYVAEEPLPPLENLIVPNDPITGTIERAMPPLRTNTWCNGADPGPRLYEVMVADQPFDPNTSAQPPYQVVTNNGRFSKAWWIFQCGG